jgi:hypothetical protein
MAGSPRKPVERQRHQHVQPVGQVLVALLANPNLAQRRHSVNYATGSDAVGSRGGDQGHAVVADHGAVLGAVVERASEIADGMISACSTRFV